ncbi:flagellar assembly protein FliW [Kineococcus indalonis]|uniref:flagellar assembly protein FliW n=1 Tax=Kineococcus indalonis TaxID=2696566 RepID=UPI00141294B0|nr:flagellar assembly protein FliW [Kineococcus indalonis]NAZ85450.1 flagellar assembly protein FliW [Kineococcus indalonis]
MSLATETAPKIEFITPLVGLSESTRFELTPLDEDGTFFSMRSMDDPDLRLVLADPMPFYPDYEPVIDGEMAKALDITSDQDGAVLAVVNIGKSLEDSTVNLMAPVVLNPRSHRAAQAVLTGSHLPLNAPLIPKG